MIPIHLLAWTSAYFNDDREAERRNDEARNFHATERRPRERRRGKKKEEEKRGGGLRVNDR